MKIFTKLLAFVVIIVSLQGCITGAYMATAAGVGAMSDKGEPDIVLKEPVGGSSDFSAVKQVRSVATANEVAATYLRDYEVFDRVVLTSKEPLTNAKAAAVARANGVDAFVFSNPGGPAEKAGVMLATVVYGTVTNSMVDRQGNEIYQQEITLQRVKMYAENMLEREIIDALAVASVKDIQAAQNMSSVAKVQEPEKSEEEKEESWFKKLNPLK
jgi:hypothetical protein